MNGDADSAPPVSLAQLRTALGTPIHIGVEGVGPIELGIVSKAKSLEFSARLEKMRGAADLTAIGVDMLRETVRVSDAADGDGLTDDDACALLAAAGGFRGALFRAAAGRCGVGELVDLMLEAIAGNAAEAVAGNLPAA